MSIKQRGEGRRALADPLRRLIREAEELLPSRRLLARVRLRDLGFAGGAIVDLAVLDRLFRPELVVLLDPSPSRRGAIRRGVGSLPVLGISSSDLAGDPVAAFHRPLSELVERLSAGSLARELLAGDDRRRVTSGIADLDRLVGAFGEGDLCMVGGAEGCGKSSLLRHLAIENGVRRGLPVTFVSLESTAAVLATDMAGVLTGLPAVRLADGELSGEEREKLEGAAEAIEAAPLTIVSEPDLSLTLLEGMAGKMALRECPPRLLLLDCLELLKGPPLPELLIGLKRLARRLGVALVASTNRLTLSDIERSDKRPTLQDLGEPGRHADKVLLLHREKVYDLRNDNAYVTEIHVVKNRCGPRGLATIAYFEESKRFGDLEVSYEGP